MHDSSLPCLLSPLRQLTSNLFTQASLLAVPRARHTRRISCTASVSSPYMTPWTYASPTILYLFSRSRCKTKGTLAPFKIHISSAHWESCPVDLGPRPNRPAFVQNSWRPSVAFRISFSKFRSCLRSSGVSRSSALVLYLPVRVSLSYSGSWMGLRKDADIWWTVGKCPRPVLGDRISRCWSSWY